MKTITFAEYIESVNLRGKNKNLKNQSIQLNQAQLSLPGNFTLHFARLCFTFNAWIFANLILEPTNKTN